MIVVSWGSCRPARRSHLLARGRPGCPADVDKSALSVRYAERCGAPAGIRCSYRPCGLRVSALPRRSPNRVRRPCGSVPWAHRQSVIPAVCQVRVHAADVYEDDLGLCIALSVSFCLPVAEDEWDGLGYCEATPGGVAQANMCTYTPVPAHGTSSFAIEIDFEGRATTLAGSRLCVFDLAPARADPSRCWHLEVEDPRRATGNAIENLKRGSIVHTLCF